MQNQEFDIEKEEEEALIKKFEDLDLKKAQDEFNKQLPQIEKFRTLTFSSLSNQEVVDPDNVSFLDNDKIISLNDIELYQQYFERRFELIQKDLIEEYKRKENIALKTKPKSFFKYFFANDFHQGIYFGASCFLVTGSILYFFPLSFMIVLYVLAIISALVYFFYQCSNKYFFYIKEFNKEKNKILSEGKDIQSSKSEAIKKIVETKYISKLDIKSRLEISKLDEQFQHLREKSFSVPRYIFENVKSNDDLWNKFALEKIFNKFHHNDEMKIEEYIAYLYKDYDISRTKTIVDFIQYLLNKRQNFEDQFADMDEETKRKHFEGHSNEI